MTGRLYYDDSYLTEFRATVLAIDEDRCRVVLRETAFYPSSGGQPFDVGTINGTAVTDVVDSGDRIIHILASPLIEDAVDCRIDWVRRFDHMQQHTGQHLLSAVIVDLFGVPTVGFHLGAGSSTIEVGAASFDADRIREAAQRANEIVFENRPVKVSYSDAAGAAGLRKASECEGILRIIEIEGLDRSACGGTHVRRTGEIGPIAIRRTEKLRGNTRIEFLCGSRAVRRARADYEHLSAVAQVFSSTLDDTPAMVASAMARLQDSEKARQKLAAELAQARGRQLYQDTVPGADGLRRYWKRVASGGIGEEIRREAQSFTAQGKAVYLATSEEPAQNGLASGSQVRRVSGSIGAAGSGLCASEIPAAVLLAVSADAGLAAAEWLKPRLALAGGKGGGNAQMAQGSLPGGGHLASIAEAIGFR